MSPEMMKEGPALAPYLVVVGVPIYVIFTKVR
jgi:hypothetical protein